MIQTVGQLLMQGKLNNHPLMRQYNQMMSGKTPEQQRETLLNYAVSRGYDRNMISNLLNSNS